jgi:hypothetical protein
MSSELAFVLMFIGVVTLPFIVVTLVVSAIRRTPIENGVRAIGWLLVVLIAAGVAGSAVAPSFAGLATYIAGAVVTYALATRDGYKFDRWSWALLVLWFIGYWIVLWRRENALWRRRVPALGERARSAS